MKEFVLNPTQTRWDSWHAFHEVVSSCVTVFDTGEAVVTHGEPDPDRRGTQGRTGLRIIATGDDGRWLLPDGTPIAAAWLNEGGQQYLLVDADRNRLVRLDRAVHEHPAVPARFKNRWIYAYIAGPGKDPVGAPIDVSRPLRDYPDKELIKYVDSLRAAAKMRCAIDNTTPCKHVGWRTIEDYRGVASIAELTDADIYALVCGRYDRWRYTVPYLMCEPHRG